MASRMPATPRMTMEASPTTVPPSSAASSPSVLVIMVAASLPPAPRARLHVQLGEHVGGDVVRLVRVDDEAARRVEHQVQALVARHLLDRGADLLHHLARGALVLLRGPARGSPDVLDEALVVPDGLLQRLLPLLALQRGQDGGLVADLGAQLVDGLLLLGGLVAPALHLAVEARLRLLGRLVLDEDAAGVDVAEEGLRARGAGQAQHRQRQGGADGMAEEAVADHGASWARAARGPAQKLMFPSRKWPRARGPSSRLKPYP